MALSSTDILTIVIFSIQKHKISAFVHVFFNLCHESIIAFSVYIFHLLKFIPKFFYAMVNGIFHIFFKYNVVNV